MPKLFSLENNMHPGSMPPQLATGGCVCVLGTCTCMVFILYSIAGADPSGRDADICHHANHTSIINKELFH